MLRDSERGCKTSQKPCPNCGAAGNYAHHGHYHRHFDDGAGERLVRVERVRCLSCKRTHALIWEDMVPYKLRSESLHLGAFRSWANGEPTGRLAAAMAVPMTSLRRMLSHVGARLSLMLACPRARAALSAAIAALPDGLLSSMHLAEHGRMIAESVRIGCARAWPAPPAGRAT
ncbi:MAG: hypothetical protein IKG18_11015 [Atopobiaceae bacterium]|nr:hypothetical protein [Atopobiaceae bacterium]